MLPDGTFDQPVTFTITRRGDDPAEAGTGSGGAPAQVDPLAGYAFVFAVPALGADAHLAFTIDLSALAPATRAALLDAIAAGSATIVTKADAPGSAYGAFARCTGTQAPDADGCVAVTLLDAGGNAAAPGSEPAFARFEGIAGHFSTYAVALVSGSGPGGGTPPPGSTPKGPSAAQIRALLRKQITPHGKAGRIGALLKRHGYGLPFRALTAGTGKVEWYRVRKGGKRVVIATGRHTFAAAGKATMTVKLTAAGRRQLRRAKHLALTAKGTFTLPHAAPVTAKRRFTLRH